MRQSSLEDQRSKLSLAVYVDSPFGEHEDGLLVHPESFGFLTFVAAVAEQFEALTVLGRESTGRSDLIPLGKANVKLHPLPTYGSLTDIPAVLRSIPRTIFSLWRGLDDIDIVWVFGPHPFAVVVAVFATLRRRRVVLGVRQDTMAYFRYRLPGKRWSPILAPVALLDIIFRVIATFKPATVVGRSIAQRYGAPREGILEMAVTLVRGSDRCSKSTKVSTDAATGPVKLLSVGRLAPEKNPLLLIDALAELHRENPGRFHLTWVGSGPMAEEVRKTAVRAGISEHVDLPGFVPFGPALLDWYRTADVFIHTAVTEGSPQVLHEAAAVSLPIIATDVGGVRAAMDDGNAALLIPPADRAALLSAISRMADEPDLRSQLARRAGKLGINMTIETESRRVARFIALGTDVAGSKSPAVRMKHESRITTARDTT